MFPNSSQEEIHEAYKRLALRWHPDRKGGDGAKFRDLTEAYATLKDAKLRREYDAKLRLVFQVCLQCDGMGRKVKAISLTKNAEHICEACMGAGFMPKR